MSKKNKAYQNIIKASVIFGSVHVSGMVISIIRTKILAVLIGSTGYGIFGLLTSTIEMVRQATGLSIETSGVKKIAEARTGGTESLAKSAGILLKVALLTGIAGAALSILFCRVLSNLTFGNNEKYLAVALVAVTIIFKQLTSAQSAIMQGLSKLNFLAKSGLVSNVASLIITLPLFYFYGIDAIVPAIIITSLINYFVSLFYIKKLRLDTKSISFREVIINGREIYFFGAMLSLSSFLPVLSNYLIQIFIRLTGNIESVGFFNVGQLLVNAYVGVIFTVMSTEYYPRLATINKDSLKENEAFNQQAIVSLLIITPVIVVFLFFKSLIVEILFTPDFIKVVPLLTYAVPAMLFKAVSLSLGYIIIARADTAVFLKTTIIYNLLFFSLCSSGYYLYGLEGLGVGFLIYFICHLAGNYIITKKRYGINITAELLKIFLTGLLIVTLACFLSFADKNLYSYSGFIILFTITTIFTFTGINKRVGLKDFIKRR
jgi:PST family polysaccharide transporter